MLEKTSSTVGLFGNELKAEGETFMQSAMNDPSNFPSLKDAREQFERTYLTRLLETTHGNVAEAAKLAQRHRTEFYRLLMRHGVNHTSFKTTT